MNRSFLSLLGVVLSLGGLGGCGASTNTTDDSYRLKLQVRNTQGASVAGARITVDKRDVGASDPEGNLIVQQTGREGQEVLAQVKCPKGYRDPALAESVTLTKTRSLDEANAQAGVVVELTCESEQREVLIVVQANGGGNLPLRVGSQAVGNTDKDGNAHLLLQLDRNQTTLELGVDTESRRELQPRSPSRSFTLGRGDAVVLYSEQLSTAKQKVKWVPKLKKQPPPRPIRLD